MTIPTLLYCRLEMRRKEVPDEVITAQLSRIRYLSKTTMASHEGWGGKFVSDPTKHKDECDILIHTPILISGVSIDSKKFKTVFAFNLPKVGTFEHRLQMGARVRQHPNMFQTYFMYNAPTMRQGGEKAASFHWDMARIILPGSSTRLHAAYVANKQQEESLNANSETAVIFWLKEPGRNIEPHITCEDSTSADLRTLLPTAQDDMRLTDDTGGLDVPPIGWQKTQEHAFSVNSLGDIHTSLKLTGDQTDKRDLLSRALGINLDETVTTATHAYIMDCLCLEESLIAPEHLFHQAPHLHHIEMGELQGLVVHGQLKIHLKVTLL